mmetsp:Transcript_13774/g.24649  ORF Transcript_13774/g.24649 Transcript_13774/m.24649 type:complete len:242 (+) Transcript_13774:302-1027(+)
MCSSSRLQRFLSEVSGARSPSLLYLAAPAPGTELPLPMQPAQRCPGEEARPLEPPDTLAQVPAALAVVPHAKLAALAVLAAKEPLAATVAVLMVPAILVSQALLDALTEVAPMELSTLRPQLLLAVTLVAVATLRMPAAPLTAAPMTLTLWPQLEPAAMALQRRLAACPDHPSLLSVFSPILHLLPSASSHRRQGSAIPRAIARVGNKMDGFLNDSSQRPVVRCSIEPTSERLQTSALSLP